MGKGWRPDFHECGRGSKLVSSLIYELMRGKERGSEQERKCDYQVSSFFISNFKDFFSVSSRVNDHFIHSITWLQCFFGIGRGEMPSECFLTGFNSDFLPFQILPLFVSLCLPLFRPGENLGGSKVLFRDFFCFAGIQNIINQWEMTALKEGLRNGKQWKSRNERMCSWDSQLTTAKQYPKRRSRAESIHCYSSEK